MSSRQLQRKTWFRIITFIAITVLVCQDLVWANRCYMLAPKSVFDGNPEQNEPRKEMPSGSADDKSREKVISQNSGNFSEEHDAFMRVLIGFYEIRKQRPGISGEELRKELRLRCANIPEEIYIGYERDFGFNVSEDAKGNVIIPFEEEDSDILIRIGVAGTLKEDDRFSGGWLEYKSEYAGGYIIQFLKTDVFSIEKHIDIAEGAGQKVIERECNNKKGRFSLRVSCFDGDGRKAEEHYFMFGLDMPIEKQIEELDEISKMPQDDIEYLLYDLLYFMDSYGFNESKDFKQKRIDYFIKTGKSLLTAIGRMVENTKGIGWRFYKQLSMLRYNDNYPVSLKGIAEDILIKFCRSNFDEALDRARPKKEYKSEDDLQKQGDLVRIIEKCGDARAIPLLVDILKAEMPVVKRFWGYLIGPAAYRRDLSSMVIPAYKYSWMNMKGRALYALADMTKSLRKEEKENIVNEMLGLFERALERAKEDLSYLYLFPAIVGNLGILKERRGIDLIIRVLELEFELREVPEMELEYPGRFGINALAEIGEELPDGEERSKIINKLIDIFNNPKLGKDYYVRLACIRGLGEMEAVEAREMLEKLAVSKDTNPYFRQYAITALGNIANHNSIYILTGLLDKAEELDELDSNLIKIILDALFPLSDKIDLLRQCKPDEVIKEITDRLGGDNEQARGLLGTYLNELSFSNNGRDEFERLFYLYEIRAHIDEISTELFIKRFPELKKITGDSCLILIAPLFLEIFGKRQNGKPRMIEADYNRFKNRLVMVKSGKAAFNLDSMKKALDGCDKNDMLMRLVFAETIRRGNVKSKVWKLNNEYFDGLRRYGINYDSLFNLNDYSKVADIFGMLIGKVGKAERDVLGIRLLDLTGYSLKEFLNNSDLFRIYADEVSEVLGNFGYRGDSDLERDIAGLYFMKGKGIEFKITGRMREDFLLGKKCGDCTNPDQHLFWSTGSYLCHPGYHTMLVFRDGVLVDKIDLVVYKDEERDELVLVIDGHEPVPQTEEGKAGREDIIREREDIVQKGIEKAVSIAGEAGFGRIYGIGISNRKFLEDYYDNKFKRQSGLMRLSLYNGIAPLEIFIQSNGAVFGEKPEIFLHAVSMGSFPREVQTAISDIEDVISKNLNRHARYALRRGNYCEAARIIMQEAKSGELKVPLKTLNVYGIPFEYAVEIIYGPSLLTAPSRLLVIKEPEADIKNGAGNNLRKIWLYDRAQRVLDRMKKAEEESERIDIFLGGLIPLIFDAAVEEGDKVLADILIEGACLINEELGRLFKYLIAFSKAEIYFKIMEDINILLMKKGYYFSTNRRYGKIAGIITLKGKGDNVTVFRARSFGEAGSYFHPIIGIPIVQSEYEVDDEKRRIEFRRAVIEETQHYFDKGKNLPLWILEAKAALANISAGPEPLEYLIERIRRVILEMKISIHDYYKEPLVFTDEHYRGYFFIALLFFLKDLFEPYEFKMGEEPDWWKGDPNIKVSLTPKEFNDRFSKIFDLKESGKLTDDFVRAFAKEVFREFFNEEINPEWFEEISSEPFKPEFIEKRHGNILFNLYSWKNFMDMVSIIDGRIYVNGEYIDLSIKAGDNSSIEEAV